MRRQRVVGVDLVQVDRVQRRAAAARRPAPGSGAARTARAVGRASGRREPALGGQHHRLGDVGRAAANQRPMISSDRPPPYTSAVSTMRAARLDEAVELLDARRPRRSRRRTSSCPGQARHRAAAVSQCPVFHGARLPSARGCKRGPATWTGRGAARGPSAASLAAGTHGPRPRHEADVRASAQSGAVDLVEVADAIADSAAAGPLPHQGVLAVGGLAAEELGAPARGQAPAMRGVRKIRRLRLKCPLVGVRDPGSNPGPEDRGPGRGEEYTPAL